MNLNSINWEDVKDINFDWHPLHEDRITITYKIANTEYLYMNKCYPLAEPPKEDVLIYIPKNIKNIRDLPKEDIDKLKNIYKNKKELKIYDKGDSQYILKPESEWGEVNKGRVEKWKKFKEEVTEKWEASKPKLIKELKEQLISKQKESEEIQNQILKLI